MSYKVINDALSDINALRNGRKGFVKVSNSSENIYDECSETTEIYSLGVDDLHVKLVTVTDSYGDNEIVKSVQIVKPIQKTVTDFEVLK